MVTSRISVEIRYTGLAFKSGPAQSLEESKVRRKQGEDTYIAECHQTNADFCDHRGVNDKLEDVERESGAAILHTEDNGCDGQSGHAEVQEYIRPRVDEAVRNPARDFLSSKGIE